MTAKRKIEEGKRRLMEGQRKLIEGQRKLKEGQRRLVEEGKKLVASGSRQVARHKRRPQAKVDGRRIAALVNGMSRAVGKSLPGVSQIARRRADPFKILVSTVLSLRTKDEVTMDASKRLFAIAGTPDKLASTPVRVIEKAIYPVGFYRTKARSLKQVARKLLSEHDGVVPDSVDELLEFKGVGRKTANLVVTLGYGKDGICVDTHVHRISNRLGLVDTKTPEHTEYALMEVLPRKYWISLNELMVSFGQHVCTPISPHCSTCPLAGKCPQVGVTTRR